MNKKKSNYLIKHIVVICNTTINTLKHFSSLCAKVKKLLLRINHHFKR